MNTHMAVSYVHCPECGHLDRHFRDEANSLVSCAKCQQLNYFRRFIQPERTEEWIAQKLGREISIVQKKDLHGRISIGWFSDSKILVANTKDYLGRDSPLVDEILELAEKEAERRNNL